MSSILTPLYSVYILTLLLLLYMIYLTVRIGNSKAAMTFLCVDISLLLIILGMFLEVMMGSEVTAALVCLKLQYVGQAVFLMSLLYFFSIFLHVKVPVWICLAQLAVNTVMLTGCMTAEYHTLFYSSARIADNGPYPMIEVTDGPIWYLHYIHMFLVLIGIMAATLVQYKNSSRRQKMRCRFMLAGMLTVTAELIMKGAGLFGAFNPFVVAAFIFTVCLYVGIFRYGYFDTVEAAKENVLNLSDEGILVTDYDGKVMYMNEKMQELFPEFKTGALMPETQIVKRIFRGENEIRLNGVYYHVDLEDVSEEELHDGKLLRLTDMTPYLKEMERLRQESESKTDFLSRVSHEIRTPLNTIRGMNEMIRKESTEPKILSYAEDIHSAEETLMSLVGDILDVTRIEKAQVVLENTEVHAGSLFYRLWRATELKGAEKGLALAFEVEPSLPVLWYTDEARLYQVVENLLSNAVKYTKQGKVTLSVKRIGERGVRIQVRDTGIGIPEESQEKIFHRFEQLQTGNRRQGLGLGLEITKSITQIMGGRIVVESEVGRGSCFTVILPMEFLSEEKVGTEWRRANTGRKHERTEYRCEGKRILVVDDNEMNRRVIKNYLKDTGILAEEADSGRECLNLLAEGNRYDLLFLDYMMPEMDGIELFHRITELPFWREAPVPVIAMTANALIGARQTYLKEGFDDYISKPVDIDALFAMLKEYLGGTLGSSQRNAPAQKGEKEKEEEEETEKETEKATEKATEKDTRSFQEQLEELGMDTDQAMLYADHSEEFLREEISLFIKNTFEIAGGIEDAIKSGEIKTAAVGLHGSKNNFATLGFTEYAARAKELEALLSDSEGAWEEVEKRNKRILDFLKEYRELSEKLKKMMETEA